MNTTSEIRNLLYDKNSVITFDIDGVLALMEYGKYNHFELIDQEWNEACERGENFYTEDRSIKKMKEFITNRNVDNIYVISQVGNQNEKIYKTEFVNKYYNIPKENVYFVKKREDKKNILFEIKKKYPKLQEKQIVMVEDSVDILNDIMENTNFATVHISTFLDL